MVQQGKHHDIMKNVDWDVNPQPKQTKISSETIKFNVSLTSLKFEQTKL